MSQAAQVLELPRFRSAHETIEPGELRWLRWPNGQGVGSAAFHPDTAAWIVERGWVTIDGIRCTARYEAPDWYDSPINGLQPPCPYTVLLEFDNHWEMEHP